MVDFVYKENYVFDDLVKLVRILRLKCPWDREQTHSSIRRNLLEEAYEAVEAIDLQDTALLKEELGDVLLQVVFHAQMEQEKDVFDIDSVCDGVCKKLVARHPHIFGDSKADTESEALDRWDEIKRKEKGQATNTEAIESVAKSLPALWRSDKILEKAEKSALLPEVDIDEKRECFSTLIEDAVLQRDTASIGQDAERAIGEILMMVVELSRRAQVDPERALEKACDRFTEYFSTIERKATENISAQESDKSDHETLA